MTDARTEAYVALLAERGVTIDARVMDDTTHTAQDAADAIGCPVSAIVKSLLFFARAGDTVEPVLVLASGPNRVDPGLIEAIVGAPVAMADAKAVKTVTGYSIGAVPPLGHPQPLRTIFDETLLALPEVWAAAGSSRAVFPIAPTRLVDLTDATVARVS
jgi:prolyl-tRNA editing enzyme YbaK/EbsC (Cys-tRNA(Pro) deacylase)